MPPSFTLKPFTEADLAELPSLQPEGWGPLLPVFRIYLGIPACRPVQVRVAGVLAGVGTAIGLGESGWLAQIIVGADFRNRGIGSAIVDHLADDLLSRGCHTISLVATELGYPRYVKAGFRTQTEYCFFERGREETLDPLDIEALEPLTRRDLEAVLRLDREFSGEDRSAFILAHAGGGVCYRSEGRLTGFYLPELGEGLVVASCEKAGRTLSGLRIRTENRSVIPEGSVAGRAFLAESGFRETRRGWRMILGRGFDWKPEGYWNRIGGNLG
jgi:GNAT superfamily N-acetyltransferase